MNYNIFLTLFAICLFTWACNGSKKASDPNSTDTTEAPAIDLKNAAGDLLVEMGKSACFGTCPVYTLKVFDNGRVEYHGVIHTNKMGVYSRQLTENDFYPLVRELRATKLEQYDDLYTSGATDFPMTTITHHQGDSAKTVKGDFERPEAVQNLEKTLTAIADSGEWVQEEVLVPYNAIRNELIVELQPNIDAADLETAFADYDLKIKKRVAPNLDLWVYQFDAEKVRPGRMLVLVRENEGVKEIEFNKHLEQRH